MNKIAHNLIGFGEEYISQICIDQIKEEVRVNIKNIFRPGPNNCEFGFDPDCGMDEGIFVITEVKKIFFDPSGAIPNDLEELDVIETSDGLSKFIFHSYEYDIKNRQSIQISFTVIGKDAYLIDLKNPDVKITE